MYSSNTPPLAISHRGLHSKAPENSIPAFLAAIDAGAEGIELDVHASADDVLFVHHDPALRVNDRLVQFTSLESGEIGKLRFDGDAGIPTLDDSLAAIGSRCDVFIEIKATGIESAVARCLRRHVPNAARYAVHAFDHRIVKRMLELAPSVRTGMLQVSYLIDSCAAMRKAGAMDLWQHVDFIDASLVAGVHSCGGRVIAWTANAEPQWESLAALGVDGICTDYVDSYIGWRDGRNS